MNYLGLDYHKKYSFATIITEEGEIKEKERLLNRKESFKEYLHEYEEVVAVVEACWNWPVAVELLEGLVDEVKLAHPLKVKAIAEARIKTDSIDSETLAYLLRADLIPEAYLRDKGNLQRQKILRMRSFYVKLRTQVKNRVHALIDGQGEEIRDTAKGYTDLFGKGGLGWLGELRLNDPDEIDQGGWGGRHGPEKKTGVPLFEWAEKQASVNAHDQKLRPYYIYTNTSEGVDSIKKWQTDIHNSLAARMDWTITSKRSEANHFPKAVLNGDMTMQILEMLVKPGEQVTLNASGSSDPDGDTLKYSWQFYKEASSYNGNVSIQDDTSSTVKIAVPSNASGKNIHIILVLHDNGSPSLHAYRRVILNVN